MIRLPVRASALVATLALAQVAGCARSAAPRPSGPERLQVRVVRTYPHDGGAFTQGLVLHGGKLFESTGLYGRSSLRRVDPVSGAVEAQVTLPEDLFGEGLALVGDRLYQLTWQNGRALVWRLPGLEKERELRYQGEGWGLCWDGKHLVMSDGSDRLVFRDHDSFAVVREVRVRRSGAPQAALNELECADGSVYANVWQESHIARIDPRSGEVTGWIDAAGLLGPTEAAGADVLNGIAHVPGTGRFFLTGKLWPRLFEIELTAAP